MKLTAKELRKIIDTLPNPREGMLRERRIQILLPTDVLSAAKNMVSQCHVNDQPREVIFKWDSFTHDWELDVNPDYEELQNLKEHLKVVKSDLRAANYHLSNTKEDLRLANLRFDQLKSKWFNKLYFKIIVQIKLLKFRIKYALH